MSGLPAIPMTLLQGADGARAAVADHGAHVLSWQPDGARDLLYLSPASAYGEGAAIRGGVPVIFPQFSTRGSGQRHGFVRNARWRREAGTDPASVLYTLSARDLRPASWPHDYALRFTVRLLPRALEMTLCVENPGAQAFDFHAALHTYLRVEDSAAAGVLGLQGCDFLEQASGAAGPGRQEEACLRFAGEVDRIYANVPGALQLVDGSHRLTLRQEGFTDAVTWNPGPDKAAGIADLSPGGAQHFVCVEAGSILHAVSLAPGARWEGKQILQLDS